MISSADQRQLSESELEGTVLRIAGPSRLNLTAKLNDTSMLTEAERGVRQEPGSVATLAGDPDPARYHRSLIDDSRSMSLNGTWSTGLGNDGQDGQLSLNGQTDPQQFALAVRARYCRSGARWRKRAAQPAGRAGARRQITGEAGVTLNKPLGDWQLTATVDGSYSDTRARTDREVDTAPLLDGVAAGTLALDGVLPALPDAGFDRARTRDGWLRRC